MSEMPLPGYDAWKLSNRDDEAEAEEARAEEEEARRQRDEDGPTDDEIYNGFGVEGGIGYDPYADMPGNNYLGEHDPRL